ncbi:hypothetical protein B0H17DRAFT_1181716 [Mycena rosella]|uniref:Uncharacterized protein n=1 Tax=Mycena rosella TaxID=1033263 RepID=A0AAD7GEX7_MYCRO|nr:hypothetical protein B0H17DRAFT_1181716 [Mycena rosella]
MKEYLQDVQGQAMKDVGVWEWSDWVREDLSEVWHEFHLRPICLDTPLQKTTDERHVAKRQLMEQSPGMLTGPDGVRLLNEVWLPWYVLSATVTEAEINAATLRTGKKHRTAPGFADLRIAVVMWKHTTVSVQAFSIFNNHLDSEATFESFVVDGQSMSRRNPYAVGEKGKGLPTGTQYFWQGTHTWSTVFEATKRLQASKTQQSTVPRTEKAAASEDKIPKDRQPGVSFRIGHTIDTLKMSPKDFLQVRKDDLMPWTIWRVRCKQTPSPISTRPRNAPVAIDNNEDCSRVEADEVSITVIGLDGSLEPAYLFSAIYGIVPPSHAWRVKGSPVQFFLADKRVQAAGEHFHARFYHRDHGIHLNRLSINDHGDLSLTADRIAIVHNHKVRKYQADLGSSADDGFRTIPELGAANEYRTAFNAAICVMHPNIPAEASIYPTATDDAAFCRELGYTPVQVPFDARSVMRASGAHIDIRQHARQLLLEVPPLPHAQLDRLRTAITILALDVP